MKDDKDNKPVYEALARIADRLEEAHRPHGCGAASLMREIGHAARRAATSGGPAQVATEQYRNNWDGIFGKKQPVGLA